MNLRNVDGSPVVDKVWGHEIWLENNDKYCGKLLVVKQGYQCSMHCHPIKDETFIIVEGSIKLELGVQIMTMQRGDLVRITPNRYHRFTGLTDAVIFEFGTPHSDDDVIRLEPSRAADASNARTAQQASLALQTA